jgi:hypothetical protein
MWRDVAIRSVINGMIFDGTTTVRRLPFQNLTPALELAPDRISQDAAALQLREVGLGRDFG